jgi:TRAP-type C4-dicarboxylate transport system permease small subunit
MERAGAAIQRAVGWVLVILMALMVVDVSWQVASRFIFRTPSSFTEELAGFLLIWIGLLGAAYGFRTGAHLGIDLALGRLGPRGRRAADILAHTLVLLFSLSTMVGGGLWLVRLAFRLDQISAAMGVRMGYVYLALPVSGVLIALFSLESLTTGEPGSGQPGPGSRAGGPGDAGPVDRAIH